MYIRHLETLTPPTVYEQSYAAESVARLIGRGDRKNERIIRQVYLRSGIQRRHSVLPEFAPNGPSGPFYDRAGDQLLSPTTGERNRIYTSAALCLGTALAQNAVANCAGIDAAAITHIITVSCTGFVQPGLDLAIVRALGLPGSTPRFHLGFMGCCAAFPALRLADALCHAQTGAVVLVVCVELCSLHLQWDASVDNLLAGALFADGAGAAIVTAKPPPDGAAGFSLDTFATAVAPASDSDMAWTIADTGFTMRLSTYVPDILKANLDHATAPLLAAAGLSGSDIDRWAVHPGGRAIVDAVEDGLGLGENGLTESREILRDFGNMSSATILFVLQKLLQTTNPGAKVGALAFGPGLTIEGAILTRI